VTRLLRAVREALPGRTVIPADWRDRVSRGIPEGCPVVMRDDRYSLGYVIRREDGGAFICDDADLVLAVVPDCLGFLDYLRAEVARCFGGG